nr:MAG TPA: Dynactin-1, Restin/beta structure, zinc finger motif.8A [Caudoviricetes sp.]
MEKEMNGLKIGDRVRIVSVTLIDEADGVKIVDGMTGTVKEVDETDVGVEFDIFMGGHDGCWNGTNGHCWYIAHECLEKIEETEEETKEEVNEEIEAEAMEKAEAMEQKILKALREEIGVAIGEEFDVYEKGARQWTCKFEGNKFFYKLDDEFRSSDVWKYIVSKFCECTFKRKQFIPGIWQRYFYLDMEETDGESLPTEVNVPTLAIWTGDIRDYGMLVLGNVFRSEEEAFEYKEKLLEKLEKLRNGEV